MVGTWRATDSIQQDGERSSSGVHSYCWWDGWALFFAGVGAIVLVEAYVRIRVPEYRKPVVSSIIFGLFMLAIGLDGLGWSLAWPAALGAIGIVILLSVWRGSK